MSYDEEEPPPHGDKDAPSGKLPQIILNQRQLRETIGDAWDAFLKRVGPNLYVRNGAMVRTVGESGDMSIYTMTNQSAYNELAESADWVKRRKRQDGEVWHQDFYPPTEVSRAMIERPSERLSNLEAIVCAPSFGANGKLVEKPGHDKESGLYYDEIEKIPKVDTRPSESDILAARVYIESEIFPDFPFASEADKAHAWALLVVPFVRQMISGPTMLHLIEAPMPGSGKSLIADVASIAFMGKVLDVTTMPSEPEETRKKITSLLMAGNPIVTFDNLPRGLKSAEIASMLTSTSWQDRVLGGNKMSKMKNRAIWITTVNNPELSTEIARRCLRIRIAPEESSPWERDGFKHEPLPEWVSANRPHIVHSILTLIQYWVSKGMPKGDRKMGSFESHSYVVGGILKAVGVQGFLQNAKALLAESDTETGEWSEFVPRWWALYRDVAITSAEIVEAAEAHKLLLSIRGDRSAHSQAIRAGRELRKVRGRVFGNYRIIMSIDPHSKSKEWKLEPMTEEAKLHLDPRTLHPIPEQARLKLEWDH